jgi:hypothetical protein
MNNRALLLTLGPAILLGLLLAGGAVLAQSSGSYNLEWNVIGGGGSVVSSANYVVGSTAGQGATSPLYSVSSSYMVSGGFWSGGRFLSSVYLPLLTKVYP